VEFCIAEGRIFVFFFGSQGLLFDRECHSEVQFIGGQCIEITWARDHEIAGERTNELILVSLGYLKPASPN